MAEIPTAKTADEVQAVKVRLARAHVPSHLVLLAGTALASPTTHDRTVALLEPLANASSTDPAVGRALTAVAQLTYDALAAEGVNLGLLSRGRKLFASTSFQHLAIRWLRESLQGGDVAEDATRQLAELLVMEGFEVGSFRLEPDAAGNLQFAGLV